jgi:MinD-like ATPase involved in chromosome partitioning or flagellar assembly
MPTTEQVRELTLDTIESARDKAEELMSTSAHGLAVVVNKARDHAPEIDFGAAVSKAREHAPDIDLSAVEVPSVDDLVQQASSHKLRTTLVVSLVLLLVVVLVRKLSSDDDEPVTPTT